MWFVDESLMRFVDECLMRFVGEISGHLGCSTENHPLRVLGCNGGFAMGRIVEGAGSHDASLTSGEN